MSLQVKPLAKLADGSDSEEERARRKRARTVDRVLTKHGVPLDNPRELSFSGKTFTLAGGFDCGTHDECAQATRGLGGRRSNAMTRDVDVLVVGTRGNPNYLWKMFGTKMKVANELRQLLRKPLIVSEYRWRNEIGH